MAKKTWKYDNFYSGQVLSPPLPTATALADLKIRDSPKDPKNALPPTAKSLGTIKAGTSFSYDCVGSTGDNNTPSDDVSGLARAFWYRIPDKGWVMSAFQGPANSGPMEIYAAPNPEGADKWAKMVEGKKKKPSGSPPPTPSEAAAAAPPYSQPPVDGAAASASVNPLVIAAIAVGIYLWTQRGK